MRVLSTSILLIIAAAATGILVGAAMVATRFVINQTAPASLAFLRYSIWFCCLLPPLLMSARVRFDRRDLAPIALLGITQFGIRHYTGAEPPMSGSASWPCSQAP
jgi:hypothetical protein